MKRFAICVSWTCVISLASLAHGQSFRVLHSFSGSDGSWSAAAPVLIGSTLYGAAAQGGDNGDGNIFQIHTDGTGFSVLHSFSGTTTGDGYAPYGLTVAGSTLYGAELSGHVFKLDTDDNSFAVLNNVTSGLGGSNLYAAPTVSGTTVYGAAFAGGSGPGIMDGLIFSMGTDGTGLTVLHQLSNTDNPYLSRPAGSLVVDGSTVYGTAQGFIGWSGIFKMATDGTGFTTVHTFVGGANDGAYMRGGLTLIGSTLYGATCNGGVANEGTVFKVNTDGTDFTVLHSFAGTDGASPWGGSLSVSGSTLFGTTYAGGTAGDGTVYEINTDGSGFQVLHSFAGGASDGRSPERGVVTDGSALYGATTYGGPTDQGVVFALTIPEPASFILLGISTASLAVFGCWRRRRTG